jgi:peptidoglycan/xylan/chitin deacetylase (PgdA/CDA1 family)
MNVAIAVFSLLALAAIPALGLQAEETKDANAAPIIILKLDDVVQSNEQGGPVSSRWKRVTEFIEKNNLKAGCGIICFSLEQDNPAYFDWLKDQQKKGRIEFWCHGYKARAATDKTGEFEQGTAEEQKAVFEKCERLAKEKLGFDLPAFGPHWSGTTAETEEALQAVPEIKIWLYGPKDSKSFKKLSLERVMAIENPTFVPDFEKFKASYEKAGSKQKFLVLQGHANAWNDERWAGFVKIIEFLQSKNCTFMTPSEYLKSVSTK